MDLVYDKPLAKNAYTVLRDAGYIPIFDRLSGKQSFVFRIQGNRYPRFHVYIEEETDARTRLHLHLDHKEHGWGERRHDSEYEGDAVSAELSRIERWMVHHTSSASAATAQQEEKPGFWKSFFGN